MGPMLRRGAVVCAVLLLAFIGAAGLQSGAVWQAAAALTLLGAVTGYAAAGAVASRRSAQSIRQVTRGIDRIAAGDLDYRVDVQSAQEAGELAAAFNRMGDSLTDAMRDLAGERNKLSAVLDTMSDGVIVVDSREEVTLINSAAAALFGGEAQARRAPLSAVNIDHQLRQLFAACRAAGERQYAEIVLTAGRRTVSAVVTPLEDEQEGEMLVTLHDLTELRQVETSRREFVSNVSHELRTPLSSIKAMAETLEDGGLADPRINADYIRRIRVETDRMTTLVNDLLELTRLQSGQEDMEAQPVDIASVIQEEGRRYADIARSLGIEARVSLPDALPKVAAQEDRMRQVVRNLLDNALKFTQEDGRINVSASTDNGRIVEVRVSDNGIGIPPESLPHIFERFYKVERSRRDAGSGLGLAIVKNIVQAFGGQVQAESKEGEGSTLSFTVPTAEDAGGSDS